MYELGKEELDAALVRAPIYEQIRIRLPQSHYKCMFIRLKQSPKDAVIVAPSCMVEHLARKHEKSFIATQHQRDFHIQNKAEIRKLRKELIELIDPMAASTLGGDTAIISEGHEYTWLVKVYYSFRDYSQM